jgi:hypothetical protein
LFIFPYLFFFNEKKKNNEKSKNPRESEKIRNIEEIKKRKKEILYNRV